MKKIEGTIKGRVQGVFFRDYTRKQAKKLGLVGWVRNKDDGSVSVVAQGKEGKLKILVNKLKKGSIPSRVDEVDVDYKKPDLDLDSFKIKY